MLPVVPGLSSSETNVHRQQTDNKQVVNKNFNRSTSLHTLESSTNLLLDLHFLVCVYTCAYPSISTDFLSLPPITDNIIHLSYSIPLLRISMMLVIELCSPWTPRAWYPYDTYRLSIECLHKAHSVSECEPLANSSTPAVGLTCITTCMHLSTLEYAWIYVYLATDFLRTAGYGPISHLFLRSSLSCSLVCVVLSQEVCSPSWSRADWCHML